MQPEGTVGTVQPLDCTPQDQSGRGHGGQLAWDSQCLTLPRPGWSSPPLTPALFRTSQSLVQGGLPGSSVPSELPQLIPVFPGGTPLLPPVVGGSIPVSSPLPPASFGLVMDPSKKLAASVLDALDPPSSALDSLDLLPYSDTGRDALDSFGSACGSLDKPSSFAGEPWTGTLICHSLDSWLVLARAGQGLPACSLVFPAQPPRPQALGLAGW